MGVRNYLIEGFSGTGKSSVCRELRRRGLNAVDGDRELAYQGDPVTGDPTDTASHFHHLWPVDRVRELVADHEHPLTYFCGGSRNFAAFVHLFDGVFVLDVDADTLETRLGRRPGDEFGGTPEQREFVLGLHRAGEDVPREATVIDATAPLEYVVDEILRLTAGPMSPGRSG